MPVHLAYTESPQLSVFFCIIFTVVFGGTATGAVIGQTATILAWLDMDSLYTTIFSTAPNVGALIGTLLAGPLCRAVSRRVALLSAVCFPFVFGGVLGISLFSVSLPALVFSRVIIGMGYGSACVLCPLIQFEAVHCSIRSYDFFFNLFICVGIALQGSVAVLLGPGLNASPNHCTAVALSLPVVFGFLTAVTSLVVPTPREVCDKGDAGVHATGSSLATRVASISIGGFAALPVLDSELMGACTECEVSAQKKLDSFSGATRKEAESCDLGKGGGGASQPEREREPLLPSAVTAVDGEAPSPPMFLLALLAMSLGGVAQFTGINALVAYSGSILARAGLDAEYAALVAGMSQVFFVLFAVYVASPNFSRWTLYCASAVLAIVCDFLMGTAYLLAESDAVSSAAVSAVLLIGFVLFFLAFQMGFGGLFFVYATIIWPSHRRGFGSGFANAMQTIFIIVVVGVFPSLSAATSQQAVLFGFGIIGLLCFLSTWILFRRLGFLNNKEVV